MALQKVAGYRSLKKDSESKAVININDRAYQEYKKLSDHINTNHRKDEMKIDKINNDISLLKDDMKNLREGFREMSVMVESIAGVLLSDKKRGG
jgi:seryl-tRNA synthetase